MVSKLGLSLDTICKNGQKTRVEESAFLEKGKITLYGPVALAGAIDSAIDFLFLLVLKGC